jgi:predicted nucleic acid-binding Zn ribbon protein
MKETPKIKCEKCGSSKMHKILSMPQINMGNHPGSGLHEVE